ncbi:MAG: STAS domain-containing protein [Pyrinomonadaceae bacterium]
MPTRITQIDDVERRATVLRIEGSLVLADAELIERICRDLQMQSSHTITLDLADLNHLDSDSASVLGRLKREKGVSIEGVHLFIQSVIKLSERNEKAS